MMIKNLSIKTQLFAGFFVLLAFVGVLGWMTYNQNKQLKYQSEVIYDHPMQVQQAVSSLRYNVLSIQRDKKFLFTSGDEREYLDAPIIALTANALTSDREVILAHGFDAYIPKPIDNTVFFETLESTLYGK